MTSNARLYAVLAAVVVFFLSWATVAAHPWRTAAPDPRLAALAHERLVLRRESVRVRRILDRRWAAYRVQLAQRRRLIAKYAAQAQAQAQATQQAVSVIRPAAPVYAAPPVVVPSAPATATRTS